MCNQSAPEKQFKETDWAHVVLFIHSFNVFKYIYIDIIYICIYMYIYAYIYAFIYIYNKYNKFIDIYIGIDR